MKNALQNLLIFLSVCLCALIAFQWHRETKLRQDIQTLTNTVQDKLEIIQNQQAALKSADEEIKRLDGLKIQLTETVKSNRTEIARLEKTSSRPSRKSRKHSSRRINIRGRCNRPTRASRPRTTASKSRTRTSRPRTRI